MVWPHFCRGVRWHPTNACFSGDHRETEQQQNNGHSWSFHQDINICSGKGQERTGGCFSGCGHSWLQLLYQFSQAEGGEQHRNYVKLLQCNDKVEQGMCYRSSSSPPAGRHGSADLKYSLSQSLMITSWFSSLSQQGWRQRQFLLLPLSRLKDCSKVWGLGDIPWSFTWASATHLKRN